MTMDSGNSSSMQSSSGGDEEYDSRAESISAFFPAPSSLAALSHHHARLPTTSLPHHPPPHSSSLFDPLSVYLDVFSRSPPPPNSSNPLLNFDMSWAHGLAAAAADHPSCTDVASLMGSAPPPPNTSAPAPIDPSRGLYTAGVNISPLPSSSQQPSSIPPPDDHHHQTATGSAAAASAAPPRSSKKRSRASRRASTTVLTTDTSNFRAMVQEFTGLPAPPFASSPFPRSRFDLFHAAAASVMRSTGVSDATSPHYLLRPFAQQLPVLSASSSSFSAPAVTGTITSTTSATTLATFPANAAAAATATTSTSMTSAIASNTSTSLVTSSTNPSTSTTSTGNYPLPPSDHLGFGSQRHSLNMFNYPSILQPSPATKYNSVSVPILGGGGRAPPGVAAMSSQAAAAAARDFAVCSGLSHEHADTHSSLMPTLTESMGLPSSNSGGGGGSSGGDDLLRWVEGPGSSDRGEHGQFRPDSGGGGSCTGSQRGSSCKLNYAGSASSEYHAERGPENVPAARGEGMMDSWICSSD